MSKASEYAEMMSGPVLEFKLKGEKECVCWVNESGDLDINYCFRLTPEQALALRDWLSDVFE